MPTGTLTTDGSEQDVVSFHPDAPGELFWFLELTNLTSSETIVIREYADIGNDGNYVQHQSEQLTGSLENPAISQSDQLLTSPDVPVKVTVELTAGSNIDIDWAAGVKH